jgi:hypothetical protein
MEELIGDEKSEKAICKSRKQDIIQFIQLGKNHIKDIH